MADFPTTPAPRTINITSIHQTYNNVGINFSVYNSSRGGHRWKFELDYALLTREECAPLWAFLVGQKGTFLDFTFELPTQSNRGSALTTDNVTVKTTTPSGNEIELEGFNSNQTNVLRAGDFISIGSGKKVYMIMSDVDSTGDEATIDIQPNLHTQATVGDVITFNPEFQVTRTSDEVNVEITIEQLYDVGTIELVEVL